MKIVCLDLEGVLVPEIWINLAKRTGIGELRATTRDVPDYDELMTQRLALLDRHGLGLDDIQAAVESMGPLSGARRFLDRLREKNQVVILSDTFYEFVEPLMIQLGRPTLFCHRIEAAADGQIVDYHLRLPDHKRQAVAAFKNLNFPVVAVGDSYNDIAMLHEADSGILFHAPQWIAEEYPSFRSLQTFEELESALSDESEPRKTPAEKV